MPGRTKAAEWRASFRDQLAPELREHIFPRAKEGGWAKVPRTLPIILNLLSDKSLSGDMDLSRTYLELLCRNFEEGFLEIADERKHAELARLVGKRGAKSWRERMRKLAQLGFIKILPRGPAEFGYVVMLHPHDAMRSLRQKGLVDDGTWNQLLVRAVEAGTPLRPLGVAQPAPVQPQPVPTNATNIDQLLAGKAGVAPSGTNGPG